MLRHFEFHVERQQNLLEGLHQANIYGFKLIRSKNSEIPLICIRHGPNLIAYRFDVGSESWIFHWKENIFREGDDSNSIDYPWFVGDILGTASDIIVIRNQSELVFLQPRDNVPGVNRLARDTRFGGSDIFTLIGNFFSDKSVVGVLKRSVRGDVRMFRTMKNFVRSRGDFPLHELPNLHFSASWQHYETKVFLADLRGQGKDMFVLLTVAGLEIHEFDQDYKLTEFMRTGTITRSSDMDTLFFGKFTNQNFNDILLMNDDGLFLYKYNDKANDMTLVNQNTDFTIRSGWRSLFADSVKIYDIDNNGIDELIFTGSNGLNVHTFNTSLSKWENILNPSKLQGLLQYSRVIGLVKTSVKVTAFAQDSNGDLHRMNINKSKYVTIPMDFEDPKKKVKPFQPSSIQPTIISRMSHHEIPILRWTEQWDAGFLKEAVRPQTGQVEFSIPLFKTGPIPALQSAIGISYSSREDSAELLGVGWTLPIADYYITVDHRGSVFPIDFDYYLIREGRKAHLNLKEYKIDSMEFEVVGQSELKISYDVSSEKWTVGNDIEQITFGDDKTFGALQVQLNWPNWKGSGTNTSELKPFIQSWYLRERRFLKTDSSVYYKYETNSASIAGKVYTTSIRLVSITDAKEFNINFEYSTKTEQEFKRLTPITAEKILTFPLQLVQSHYVKSCNVQTSTFQQKLQFDYQLRNGKRLLVQISQPMKGNTESIFLFDYKEELNNFIMSTCQFMRKTNLSFDYSRTTSLIPPFSLQYSVNERPQVTFGSDYAVMAYKMDTSVEFRLTNRALTIPIFKGTTSRKWSNEFVQSFSIAAFHNSFVISQTTGLNVEVFTFSKEDDAWSETPSIESFNQLSLLCYSENFYSVAEPNANKLLIMERDRGQSKWKRNLLNNPGNVKLNRLAAQKHMIVGRAVDQVILYYKNGVNDWTSDIIDQDEILHITEKTMSMFHINPEYQTEVFSTFDRERLQVFNNMIVASGLQDKDGDLILVAKLYLLDSNHKIAKTFVQKVTHEKLKIQLCKDGLFIGDDTFLRMTGTEWRQESRPSRDYVMLGTSFVLGFDQTDTASVYLHYQKPDGKVGDLIKHIKLNGPGQFINRYPAYLSYQLNETTIIVQTFKDPKTLGKEESYTGEDLMDSSNLTNLMTVARIGSHFEWRVRSLSNFMDKKVYSIVEKWSITNDNVSRTTAYERSSTYNRDERVVEESLRIIPGGNKDVSGWIEHVLVNNMETSERTTTTNYYNAVGNLVSVDKKKANDDAEKTSDISEGGNQAVHQIFDKTGHLEISNFTPYKVSDDEGLYLGFESYEENHGVEFDADSIVRGKFAFTGESYLYLQSNERLTKVLKPKDTNNIFIASCYVRSSSPVTLKSEVKYLRATITAERMQGKEIVSNILRQSGEWFYLESYIDLITLTRQHGQLQGLEITIEITSDSDAYIDLDHIRFSPLTQNFEASVFNPQNGKITAKITDNGLVHRTIFDRQNREIGKIKNNEQIEHFTRATKTGEIIPPPRTPIHQQPSSKMKFEPESGFYEHFDATAFSDRWSVSDENVWSISRGQLIHRGVDSDSLTLNANLINESCAALRFGYNLRLIKSSVTLRWSSNISMTFSSLSENQATLTMNANRSTVVDNLPVSGELLIFIEVERIVVWIDGVLIIDQGHGYGDHVQPWSEFNFEMTNYLIIEDLFIMNRPRISLEYFNGFGEKVQVLQFESDKVIQVSQTLYDELGRNVILTKPTKITRNSYETLFAFYPEFVHNDKQMDPNSVWKTGLLKGDVDTLNKNDLGVPYFQTRFDSNPLKEKISVGLPSPAYSVNGPNAKHFVSTSKEDFLSSLFPAHLGYKKQAEILPNGSERISVVDSKKNIVARSTRVTGSDHILSTFEYDDDNRLIKILPPLYHELAETVSNTQQRKSVNKHKTETSKNKLQGTYGSHFIYDRAGRLIEKRTPDTGTVKFIYTSDGSLRFMVTVGLNNVAKRVVYLFYDEFQQLVRTGHISSPISLTELQYYLQGNWIPNAVDYQLIQYSDENEDTLERGFMKSFMTYSGMEPVKEIIRFNDDFDMSSRDILGLPQQISFDISSPAISVRKDYNRKRVASVTYPGTYRGKSFKLVYTYDKLGNVVALGTGNHHKHFATFTYHINGLVASETHTPTSESTFSRLFKYNSPGHLERISDPYLTENISYTHGGYGMTGFGDETILLTTYNPKWANYVDHRLFRVHNVDEKVIPVACVDALKRLGYLDSLNNPKRVYIPEADLSMPLKCRNGEVGLRMAKLIAEKHVPRFYGFRFAYGNYKEVINGKYFTDETHRLIEPLQRHTFSKFIKRLSKEQSEEIFDILASNKFILSDRRTGQRYGRSGETFFRDNDLEQDLKKLNEVFGLYSSVIMTLLTSNISQRKSISLEAFQSQFVKWHALNNDITVLFMQRASYDSTSIFEMLKRNGYMTQTAFKTNFINVLSKYTNILPEIVAILNHHFIYALGRTPFDVESYNIDANGNHRIFHAGFKTYEFAYKDGTSNQITNVKINDLENGGSGKSYKMEHDDDGNVVQALHKNIAAIEYNQTSQKPTSIRLSDGRTITFFYDAQGERILKRVLSANRDTTKDTYYIRNEEKRVLLERQITYFPKSQETVVTMYIHGPRGLIGFIRNDKFHSVITDHAGSIRLIIRDGMVVAAFDYLPYGKTMRLYYTNPQDLIAYRYMGQEFDEETELYNYHARLYDPDIGRFYQLDPLAQYYSPYKYAVNSFMDSNGESDIAATVYGTNQAISEAYLGGSAANDRWNKGNQNLRDFGTSMGSINDERALLPTSFSNLGSAIGETISQNIAGMFLSASAANGDLDPNEWKWDSPATWNTNGFFQGFATGLSLTGERIAVKGDTSSVVMANYGNAAFWEWDYGNPDTWNAILSGYDSGIGMTINFVDVGRSFRQLAQNPNKLNTFLSKVNQMPSNMGDSNEILKNPSHPLYKVAVISASADNFKSDVNVDFNVKNTKNTFGTYQETSNGVFFARDTNERLTSSLVKRKQPKPEMVQLISYRKIDTDRVRRFAMVPNDQHYFAAIFNATSELITSTDSIQSIQYASTDSIISASSGSSRIIFWPSRLFQMMKTTFHLAIQYFEYGSKQSVKSEHITLSSNEDGQLPEPFTNYSPEAQPGLKFDELKDNYSVLRMGDQWLANTSMQGNLMWAFIFMRKLIRYKSNKSKLLTPDNFDVEFGIQAYEIVSDFLENVTEAGVSCGIKEITNKIVDSGDLDYLFHEIKMKLVRRECDEIAKMLLGSLNCSYISKIDMMSSPKKVRNFMDKIEKNMLNVGSNLRFSSSQSTSVNVSVNLDRNKLLNCANNANANTDLQLICFQQLSRL